ncbi:hypothetical protein HOE67_01410 [Candidatus Peregrinibacteria bacterium]|jgi:hypothetical protein|nr:hypothetical protein [Candidatus Peregrinibacteria bacterium]MBT4055745.1 hypothetical protein [Candidatus Peregrinibacteria bacterium]
MSKLNGPRGRNRPNRKKKTSIPRIIAKGTAALGVLAMASAAVPGGTRTKDVEIRRADVLARTRQAFDPRGVQEGAGGGKRNQKDKKAPKPKPESSTPGGWGAFDEGTQKDKLTYAPPPPAVDNERTFDDVNIVARLHLPRGEKKIPAAPDTGLEKGKLPTKNVKPEVKLERLTAFQQRSILLEKTLRNFKKGEASVKDIAIALSDCLETLDDGYAPGLESIEEGIEVVLEKLVELKDIQALTTFLSIINRVDEIPDEEDSDFEAKEATTALIRNRPLMGRAKAAERRIEERSAMASKKANKKPGDGKTVTLREEQILETQVPITKLDRRAIQRRTAIRQSQDVQKYTTHQGTGEPIPKDFEDASGKKGKRAQVSEFFTFRRDAQVNSTISLELKEDEYTEAQSAALVDLTELLNINLNPHDEFISIEEASAIAHAGLDFDVYLPKTLSNTQAADLKKWVSQLQTKPISRKERLAAEKAARHPETRVSSKRVETRLAYDELPDETPWTAEEAAHLFDDLDPAKPAWTKEQYLKQMANVREAYQEILSCVWGVADEDMPKDLDTLEKLLDDEFDAEAEAKFDPKEPQLLEEKARVKEEARAAKKASRAARREAKQDRRAATVERISDNHMRAIAGIQRELDEITTQMQAVFAEASEVQPINETKADMAALIAMMKDIFTKGYVLKAQDQVHGHLSRIIEDLVATRVADEKEFAAELQAAMTSRTSPTSPKNGGNGEVITEVPVETVEVETTDFFGDPFKQGDSASI